MNFDNLYRSLSMQEIKLFDLNILMYKSFYSSADKPRTVKTIIKIAIQIIVLVFQKFNFKEHKDKEKGTK